MSRQLGRAIGQLVLAGPNITHPIGGARCHGVFGFSAFVSTGVVLDKNQRFQNTRLGCPDAPEFAVVLAPIKDKPARWR